ncbi:hypothetical protein SAMN04487895_101669 [Paenibacillus sophorae]|uniref:Uncharacterized protein n=1 Tax=Paenibacillus sophorae TaxID=1333845 RepID=A0A1H8GX88_9BACL|nr:hypothetical protein [Paenibacillus sophorae]QWU14364.1 hypothetical protein KP014_20880 [Paenibacillus sophorae]SEN48334.1 hypothetical protein SAMN04487895_101669 [Paenibacillus sophorae]
MIEWKDKSSYSRNDKEKVPNCWLALLNGIDVKIHRHIYYPKDTWLMSSDFMQIKQQVLENTDDELARQEAIEKIKTKIEENIAQLKAALELMK